MEPAHYRALVVEDSTTMRHLIVFALKRMKQLTVVEADDGVEALRKLQADKYDLLITDINMPVMDGFKLVSMVRNDASMKGMPIIVITTEGGEDDRKRAIALGANAYISKPVQAPVVANTVKMLLGL
jgi:two-component system chemotaxis response regulator CheY